MTRVAIGLRGRCLLAVDVVGIAVTTSAAHALRFDQLSAPVTVPAFPTAPPPPRVGTP